jgi:ketosteroid isomerase-like protein
MPQENVEIARRAWEAATRRPKPDWPTTNALYHPDHELVAVMGETHRGAAGYRDWITVMEEAAESWEVGVEEATDLDKDRVLLVWTGAIRGRQSHAAAKQQSAAILTIQDGKVTRTEIYASPEQALEAVGLAEQR